MNTSFLNFLFSILAAFGLSLHSNSAVASDQVTEPQLSSIFSDGVVLQRDRPILIGGYGAQLEHKITVFLGDTKRSAVIKGDPIGTWSATFPGRSHSAKSLSIRILVDGQETNVVNEVVVGDVWIAAGQSNMQMQVKGLLKKKINRAQTWVDSADFPLVRLKRVHTPVVPGSKQSTVNLLPSPWNLMTPETVENFSAVAAVFAREIHTKHKVPIGIIDVSWGGKPIEPFIPAAQFETDPLLRKIADLADADKLDELAQLEGGVIIRNPEGHPSAIYNARMAALNRFPISGFIWYQGESNSGKKEDPRHYSKKMQAMVRGWREDWQSPQLPFLFVQLPSYEPATGWIRLREEQRLANLEIAHSAMAVTIDLPGKEIHPPHKFEVGKRLALLADREAYSADDGSVTEGPTLSKVTIMGEQVTLQFNHAGPSGLAVGSYIEGPDTVQLHETQQVEWFEICGKDQQWFPAHAKISGKDTVTVSSPKVPKPVAVRYATATAPQGKNLYNHRRLPASPFCTKPEWLEWQDQ